jgi:hypothetical protein
MGGAIKPATTPPNGWPVCLIEKIRFRFRGVATRIIRCEAAGFVSPYPVPRTTEPATSPQISAVAINTQPPATNKAAVWFVRIPPKRRTNTPAIVDIPMAPA